MSLYPSPPDLRIQYDRDGSTGFYWQNGSMSPSTISAGLMRAMADEDFSTYFQPGGVHPTIGFIFPELRDLVAYYISGFDGDETTGSLGLEVSANTTSGADGTWTSLGAFTIDHQALSGENPRYRSAIQVPGAPAVAIKACRFNVHSPFSNDCHTSSLHLYGHSSSGGFPAEVLRPWHPTLNQMADGITADFGDIARATTSPRTFRIKNMSATKTAKTIMVSEEALTDASPTVIGQLQLSADGITFANSINIGDLAPGAISPVLTWRNNVASSAAISVWAFRMVAIASSWV